MVQIYVGYITNDLKNYTVYDIEARTYKSARLRLKGIIKRLLNRDGEEYTIEHLFKPGEVTFPEVNIMARITVTV